MLAVRISGSFTIHAVCYALVVHQLGSDTTVLYGLSRFGECCLFGAVCKHDLMKSRQGDSGACLVSGKKTSCPCLLLWPSCPTSYAKLHAALLQSALMHLLPSWPAWHAVADLLLVSGAVLAYKPYLLQLLWSVGCSRCTPQLQLLQQYAPAVAFLKTALAIAGCG